MYSRRQKNVSFCKRTKLILVISQLMRWYKCLLKARDQETRRARRAWEALHLLAWWWRWEAMQGLGQASQQQNIKIPIRPKALKARSSLKSLKVLLALGVSYAVLTMLSRKWMLVSATCFMTFRRMRLWPERPSNVRHVWRKKGKQICLRATPSSSKHKSEPLLRNDLQDKKVSKLSMIPELSGHSDNLFLPFLTVRINLSTTILVFPEKEQIHLGT